LEEWGKQSLLSKHRTREGNTNFWESE